VDIKLVVVEPVPVEAYGSGAKQVLRIDIPPQEVRKFMRWLGKRDVTDKYAFRLI